ncbi:hypothetical protein DQP55_10010 [Mycolicibacterium sp. GF69]|nr:wax ester/triacylglycerol synthase domain-containing protein [Mycolicibacterium sp. GF69]RAV13560.1 hypothetical protein DQP55_10010 [Mycolicibacterium sp. GF69]
MYAGQRATGRKEVIQVVWVYEHPIDFDGLRRFHHYLGLGLLGRRIERSPVPFARHRWVSDPWPLDIDVAQDPRPRAELSDWADERAQLPIDSEVGPGWHLDVLPLTDGSTAVSLVVSHCLIDGLGLGLTLAEAVLGSERDLGYPPPRTRTRPRALGQDLRLTAQEAPAVGRALVDAATQARRRRQNIAQSPTSRSIAVRRDEPDEAVVVPSITISIDIDDWDHCAKTLGGTSSTLVAGFGAKLGERIGRRRADDGAVTLHLPLSERTDGDTRANAMTFAHVSVDPEQVTTDLRGVRTSIKEALRNLRETEDESMQFLRLVPFIPKRALKRLQDVLIADPDLPVFCSNLGDFGSVVVRIDGSDAEYATARLTWQHATRQWLERTGGQMVVQSWRLGDTAGISVCAYQPGATNTKPALRELAARTLADFGLVGDIV